MTLVTIKRKKCTASYSYLLIPRPVAEPLFAGLAVVAFFVFIQLP